MPERRIPVTAKIKPAIEAALRQEASRRGVSGSSIIEEALERELLGQNNEPMLKMLASIFVVRELVFDLSPRSMDDKQKLWAAMNEHAKKTLAAAGNNSQ